MMDFASNKRGRSNAVATEEKQAADNEVQLSISEAAPGAGTPELETVTAPTNPWNTINDMLIQNRCWLCHETFRRGKMKKVFMLSHLLTYAEERYKLEEMVAAAT